MNRYVAFDVETPNRLNNRMSAIGITVIEDGIITDSFYSLVDPEQPFDWDLIAHYEGKTPFLVAGAVGADSVEKLRDVRHPLFAGIEVGAKFETEPGMIDVPALNDFLKLVK